jgi:hypothetical protein
MAFMSLDLQRPYALLNPTFLHWADGSRAWLALASQR